MGGRRLGNGPVSRPPDLGLRPFERAADGGKTRPKGISTKKKAEAAPPAKEQPVKERPVKKAAAKVKATPTRRKQAKPFLDAAE